MTDGEGVESALKSSVIGNVCIVGWRHGPWEDGEDEWLQHMTVGKGH